MKSTAIFKIIVWSLVSVFFIVFFITIAVTDGFAGGKLFSINLPQVGGDVELVREQEFSVDEIDGLDLKGSSESIYIYPTDGDDIIVSEKASYDISEKELLQISKRDGTLVLEQGDSLRSFFIFNFGRRIVNEIGIPEKEYKEIKTKMSSGKLEIKDIQAKTVDTKMTSGRMNLSGLIADIVSFDMSSGKGDISGSINDINAEMTSGLLNIETDIAPANLAVDITSGKCTVTIPDNDGFIVGINKTSGAFNTDFEVDEFNRYGNGERQYNIKMTSGLVELLKKR